MSTRYIYFYLMPFIIALKFKISFFCAYSKQTYLDLCILLGAIHKWRHAKITILRPPPLHHTLSHKIQPPCENDVTFLRTTPLPPLSEIFKFFYVITKFSDCVMNKIRTLKEVNKIWKPTIYRRFSRSRQLGGGG